MKLRNYMYFNNKNIHMNPIHDCFAKALPASAMILAVGLYTAEDVAAGEHTLSIRPIDEEVLLDTIEITQAKR